MSSYTINCYFGNVSSGAFTHPESNQAITLREAARLPSVFDRYEIKSLGAMRQIGNAVPPLVAKAIAAHIQLLEDGNISQGTPNIEPNSSCRARTGQGALGCR